jgi:hypothetical protein
MVSADRSEGEFAALPAETGESRDEESRLKAGCSQDWLPHNRLSLNLPTRETLQGKYSYSTNLGNSVLSRMRRVISSAVRYLSPSR